MNEVSVTSAKILFLNTLRPEQTGQHFSNAFSRRKMFLCWLTLWWNLFPRVRQTITWTNVEQYHNVEQWRHNDHDGVKNHQHHGCLCNRLFRHRWKKTSKLRVTGLCVGNSPGPVNSPHKGPVTRKMFSFDDVIMRHHDGYDFIRLRTMI